MTQLDLPDFDERLVEFESVRFMELRPGQCQVLAAYAEHHLNIGNHRNHDLLNVPTARPQHLFVGWWLWIQCR